jgi:DNA-binding protein HU-beta
LAAADLAPSGEHRAADMDAGCGDMPKRVAARWMSARTTIRGAVARDYVATFRLAADRSTLDGGANLSSPNPDEVDVEVVPVNKSELIEAIASASMLSKPDAERALNALIESVQVALAGGDKVTLPGFGTFALSTRQARTGMNPRTREPIQIPASKSAKFTMGSEFKKRMNA